MSGRDFLPRSAVPMSDEALMRVADILGGSSEAQRAIAERERRRGLGEDVAVYWVRDKGLLLVGPRKADEPGEEEA